MEAVIKGHEFTQEFSAGTPVGVATAVLGNRQAGMSVTFKPDPEIFSDAKLSSIDLRTRLEELAFLHTGVSISFENEHSVTTEQFRFDDGIRVFVESLNRGRTPLHDVALIRGEEKGIDFEVGIQFCRERDEVIRSYANDLYCPNGGTHIIGVRIGLTRAIELAVQNRGEFLNGSTQDNGLTAVISVRMKNPRFMGANRNQLNSPEAQRLLATKVSESMSEFFTDNPDVLEAIVRADS